MLLPVFCVFTVYSLVFYASLFGFFSPAVCLLSSHILISFSVIHSPLFSPLVCYEYYVLFSNQYSLRMLFFCCFIVNVIAPVFIITKTPKILPSLR